MGSKRAASPFPACDLSEPKAIKFSSIPKQMKRPIEMKWKPLPLYKRIATARDEIWNLLYSRAVLTRIDERSVFPFFQYTLREDAQSNPHKFKIALRQECPSFANLPISADSIDNLDEVMNHPEVTEWLERQVQLRRNQLFAYNLHEKISRQLFWCSQLGLGAMELLGFRMKSFDHYWKVCYDRQLERYTICTGTEEILHDHRNPTFKDPCDDVIDMSVPRMTVPLCPPADYFPDHLPRCIAHFPSPYCFRDLTPIILYAPILVSLFYGVDGFDLLIIQRIASFLWKDLV